MNSEEDASDASLSNPQKGETKMSRKKTKSRIAMMALDIIYILFVMIYDGYMDWPTIIPACALPVYILISILSDRKKRKQAQPQMQAQVKDDQSGEA